MELARSDAARELKDRLSDGARSEPLEPEGDPFHALLLPSLCRHHEGTSGARLSDARRNVAVLERLLSDGAYAGREGPAVLLRAPSRLGTDRKRYRRASLSLFRLEAHHGLTVQRDRRAHRLRVCEVMRPYARLSVVMRLYALLCGPMQTYAVVCGVIRSYAVVCADRGRRVLPSAFSLRFPSRTVRTAPRKLGGVRLSQGDSAFGIT